MASQHLVGYAKSARARCHGPLPCKNSPIAVGALRYGKVVASESGQQIEWRHWGCVTKDILEELARVTVNSIGDFSTLQPSDQQKVRMAITRRYINPADIPASARVRPVQTTRPPAASTSASASRLAQITQVLSQPSATSVPKAQKRPAEGPPAAAPRVTFQAPLGTAARAAEQEEEDVPMEEEVKDELYCVLTTKVVGIQYYKGLVGPGEQVLITRELNNPHDRNAIQVKNMRRIQVGHLPREVAAKLAPLLDQKKVTVEGTINDGNMGGGTKQWTLSISLKFYGAADKRNVLEPLLVWATPGQRGFQNRHAASQAIASSSRHPSGSQTQARGSVIGSRVPPSHGSQAYEKRLQNIQIAQSAQQAAQVARQEAILKQTEDRVRKAAEMRKMIDSLEKVDDEGRRTSLLDTVCSKDDILNLPLHPNPPGIANGQLKVDLLKHQSQALQWCIRHENPSLPKTETDPPVQFWQLRKANNRSFYLNIATKTPQQEPPVLGKGALCADAMGLGKTLTMIALILATLSDKHPNFSGATLIVAPVSILSNWEKQIVDHCTASSLSYFMYYGTNRNIDPDELKEYDVVITTYGVVAGEHGNASVSTGTKKRKTGARCLFDIPWKRIILDEGHVIRNPKTKMAKAVCDLEADRRWVLSGTPIINSPRDLGSMLTFLRICQPLDNEDYFKRLIMRPLKNGDPDGAELLKALMSHVCIRRTKEMQDANGVPLIALPSVDMIRVPVTLDNDARMLYDQIEAISKQHVENMIKSSNSTSGQANILSMLTRLRQIALHPGLIPSGYLDQLLATDNKDTNHQSSRAITPEEKIRLQQKLALAIEDCEECPICFDVLDDDPRITSCAHCFCYKCILQVINQGNGNAPCPLDRRRITTGDLYEKPPPTELTQMPVRDVDMDSVRGSSAKIDQLVQLLRIAPEGDKSLVFSQFTSFLDKVGEAFEKEGIPYVRFDGQMSEKRRQEAISRFSVPVTLKTNHKGKGKETDSRSSQSLAQTQTNGRPRRSTRAVKSVITDDNCADSDEDYNPFSDDADAGDDLDNAFDAAVSEDELPTVTNPRKNDNNPKVMLISLKAGALGLNLTVANHVYLMDPWWQEGIESQAIDRCNRIGQKKPVHVYQMIAENTVESKVLDIQDRKKQLIKQAFSGIKSRETPRQQREARLQDLVELFGLRQRVSVSQES